MNSSGFTRRGLVAGGALGAVTLAAAPGPAAASNVRAGQPPVLLGHVAGSAVELPPLLDRSEAEGKVANPDPLLRKLGVAVVGLGHLSLLQILPGFAEARHVQVTALVSGEPAKAQAVAAQYGVPASGLYDYASFDRIRDDNAVDIVYVVLPNSMHREYVERAAAAGKHVLCEKPMATNSSDARAMIAACRSAGKRLMIAYRCQYEPTNRAAIKLARSGELGKLRLIEAVNGQNNADNGQWRHIRAMAGGGSLPDVGIYCLNAARFLTGEEPVEVSARLTRPPGDRRFREVEDICAFTLQFPSGVVANCTSGYSFHESRQLRMHGAEAWAQLDPAFGYDNLALQIGRKAGQAGSVEMRRFAPKNQFALEMDHFAEAIRANRVPRTPGEEGLQDMKLIEAIYQAAAGHPMTLPAVAGRDVTRGVMPDEGG